MNKITCHTDTDTDTHAGDYTSITDEVNRQSISGLIALELKIVVLITPDGVTDVLKMKVEQIGVSYLFSVSFDDENKIYDADINYQ